jgi:hypothetical protein
MTKPSHLLVSIVLTGAETALALGCARSAPADRSVASSSVESTAPSASSLSSERPPVASSDGSVQPAESPRTTAAVEVGSPRCPVMTNEPEPGTNCGELHCLAFSSELDAFRHVLALGSQVIGIGESHAPKGLEGVHSATRRFGEQLLPALCGRARSMVIELWLPRNDCGDKRVEQVKKAQEPVTRAQAKSNQDDYVTLGHVAKRFGIMPSALVPSCDEYQSILDAGADGIERMLELVAQRTGEQVLQELRKYPQQSTGPIVVTYGGALHNDAAPDEAHARYSYGPKLLEQTQGRYLELDLVVPEFVKDTELWKRQPWYSAFKSDREPAKAKLYQWAEHSFALVYPRSKP